MNLKNRNHSIDWIKAIASFSVTAVHFRNRVETKIPEYLIGNKVKIFFSFNYAIFIFAVPLFLLVTGYLSTYVKSKRKRYIDLLKVYLFYIFMAIISYQFMILAGIREQRSLYELVYQSMRFKLISGWYIELYFGLFLLIPYLNLILDALDKKQTLELIMVLFIIISIPSLINKHPLTSNHMWLPNFYVKMYPVVYYMIGGYIRRYLSVQSISIIKNIRIYILSLLFIIITLYKYSNPYTKSFEGYYQSIVNVTLSTSFFLICYKIFSNKYNKYILIISKYTLSTYIMSLPVDRIFYPKIANLVGNYIELIKYSPLVIITMFIIALISGIILTKCFDFLYTILQKIIGVKIISALKS